MKHFTQVLKCIYFAVCLFTFPHVYSQVYEGAAAHAKLKGAAILRLNEHTGNIQYALLSEAARVPASQAPEYAVSVYKLKAPYGLKLIRSEQDELGFTHLRYQQTYNNIPVTGGILIIHTRGGLLHSFNGEVFNIGKVVIPELTESTCLKIALDTIHAGKYMWEVPEEEAAIKEIKEDANATWYPKGELVYCPVNLDFNAASFFLAYRFTIHASEPRTGENLYVDVLTGEVKARENLLHTTDVNGTAVTKYSGTRTIITDSTSPANFRLRENTRGNGVYTFNLKKSTSYGTATDFTDSNNIWNNVNANYDEVATDCHWGAEMTYDYYKIRHGRNSYNNANARINSFVHYSVSYDNAFWDGIRMTYGDGNAFKPLTSLDVCGHEITHAVTSNSANLVYSYESGALNESFSDMFGNAIERYAKPGGYSWKIGEEITYDGSGLRNMTDPRIKGNPRCYQGTNWYSGTGDNGGVHNNSGVQNWWFYLVSEGGTGTNDFSNAYRVDSLGILAAEKIAYRNLTVYLTPSSQYADARFYSIRAATDLYGNCSKEVISVTNAWYACHVGAKYDSGYVKADFTADTVVCSSSKQVNFTNLSTNSNGSKWYFGDAATSTATNPTHTYSGYGNFTIKLVSTSCFKNIKDSLTRTAYVKIDSTFDICNGVLMPASGTDSTHKCQSFVYDDGGEGIYAQQRTTMFRISAPGADSIRIKFLDFDYENGFDSLYVFKGKYPGGTKVGGFTGSSLPFGGNNFAVAGNMVTLRHVSDPFVVGRGFKLFYTVFKKPVDVTAYSDTTICKGTSVILHAIGAGGYSGDYVYNWKNLTYNDSVTVTPTAATVYKVYLRDVCTKSFDSAQVTVTVRNPLDVSAGADTTICAGGTATLKGNGSGGRSSTYTYTWDNSLGSGVSKSVTPNSTTRYRVILSDACTPVLDTAFVNVTVRSPLSVKVSTNDTLICYNKSSNLMANGSGGNMGPYSFTWSTSPNTAPVEMANLKASTWVKVSLSDGCTVKPGVDSVYVVVKPQLKVNLNNDSLICRGTNIILNAQSSGGKVANYIYSWNQGLQPKQSNTVTPTAKIKYKVTLKDNCSDDASDSITVSVMSPLDVWGLTDTTICIGQSVPLNVLDSGGRSGTRVLNWSGGLGTGNSQLVSPFTTTVYKVTLSDACTKRGDTATTRITVRGPLSADLVTQDTLVCYSKAAVMNAGGTGGDTSGYVFTWDNGLGTGKTKNLSLTSDTWVHLALADGCTSKSSQDSVFIQVRPPLQLALNADTAICKGNSVDLLPVVTGGDQAAYAYTWNQGLPSVKNQAVNPVTTTLYKLVVKDHCSDDVTDSIRVTVAAGLKISGLKDTAICYGGKASLNPVLTGGIPSQYQYTWDNALGSALKQQPSPLGTTRYKIVLKDNCTVPYDSAYVTVSVRDPLKLGVTVSKYSFCAGDSSRLDFAFSGGVPAQYEWYVNGVQNYDPGITVKPLTNTNYTVSFKDRCSMDADSIVNIVVNPMPVADFQANDSNICKGNFVTFTNNSSGADSYDWDFNGTDHSSVPAPAYAYQDAGTFDVTLAASTNAGCSDTFTHTGYIKVYDLPVANFRVPAYFPDMENPQMSFKNLSSTFTRFMWDFGDGTGDTLNLSPVHLYRKDTGSYLVTLITYNSRYCSDTMMIPVRVIDVFRLFLPNAISVNNDGINDVLRVGGRGIMNYRMEIFNRWGEKVYSGNESSPPFTGKDAQGEMLMKGSYLVVMQGLDFAGRQFAFKQMLELL